MKRYLLFVYDTYEPSGGFLDFFDSFDSVENAERVGLQIIYDRKQNWHVLDAQTWKIVKGEGEEN